MLASLCTVFKMFNIKVWDSELPNNKRASSELLINSKCSCDQCRKTMKRKGSPKFYQFKHNQTGDDVKGEFMNYQLAAHKTPFTTH